MAGKQLVCGCVAVLAVAGALHGQEQPLSVIGTFTTGYYGSTARGDTNQSLSYIPVGARFEMNGYLKSPDLLNFWAQPELTYGPQASEAGFQGGNGIRFRITAFRKLIPLTFRYSNVQEEDVFVGSLSQVSGYTLKNRNTEIGVTMVYRSARLPSIMVDWAESSTKAKSGIAQFSDFVTDSSHVTVDSQYQRWGWQMAGFMHYRQQTSDVLYIADGGGLQLGTLDQSVTQLQGSVSKTFMRDSSLYVDGGRQATSTTLFEPIDLSSRYADANLLMFQKRRVRTALRVSYASNAGSQLLAQATGTMSTTGASIPDQNTLQALSHAISTYNISSITNATLTRGLEAYVGFERRAFSSPDQTNVVSANYWAGSAGMVYQHQLSWGSVSGEYGRQLGLGSITGQSGTVQGQTFQGSVQKGGGDGLEFDGVVHGTTQSIQSSQPISSRNLSAEGNISDHLFGQFRGRAGGGYQWATVENNTDTFNSGGYTARVGITHPIFQVTASLNDTVSNTLPFYNTLLGGIGAAAILPGSLIVIPSAYRATTFTVHTNPLPKLEVSGTWTRTRQHLNGVVDNDFQFINAFATYRFRKIMLEAGYLRIQQSYSFYPLSMRSRVYLRISRREKLL